MISQIFLKSVGKSFLLVGCFASSMLVGSDYNKKYSVVVLAPREEGGKIKHEVDVLEWKRRGIKSSVKCNSPVERAFWHKTEDNILYIILADGTEREVNVEAAQKITI